MLSESFYQDSIILPQQKGRNAPKNGYQPKSVLGENQSILKDLTMEIQDEENRLGVKGPDGKVLERLVRGEKQKFSLQEMKEINRRMRSRLPEVKKADEKKKLQDEIKQRKDKLKEFNKVTEILQI